MKRYVAITGGIGGAKLALGFAHLLPPDAVTFIVNTGDDFDHLGFRICPDIDTLCYTLSGLANTELGWGRADETWHFMDTLAALGGETWFNLGDRDLALHAERTRRLKSGANLTAVTAHLARVLGVGNAVLPMTDSAVSTVVHTATGELAFQHYFVRDRCAPAVTGFRFDGIERAKLTPEVRHALTDPNLAGVVICPSNPFVSIDPVLAVPGLRGLLADAPCPVIAISPIVGGKAIKGPTAKMMQELQIPTTAVAVARHYAGVIDGFVLDATDTGLQRAVDALGPATVVAQTVMLTLADRVDLARRSVDFLNELS
jgi:LPPG:FO 2-phospho-L-lactate transferase